jgi:hypothetical protein
VWSQVGRGWTQAAIAARFGLSRGSVQDRLRTATRTLLEVDGGHAFIADGLVVQSGHL